jgi:protein O-mannosyl-transferase
VTRSPKRARVALPLAILVALNVVAYAAVTGHRFVNFDDPDYVAGNPYVVGGFSRAGVAWAFSTGTAGNWHPLTWLSHMLDVQLFGLNAGRHHLTSLLLHIANTLFLFGVFVRMTGATGRSLFVAALFGVHPLHVESVAWVAERKDVLSTCFAMLTMWSYVSYVRKRSMFRYAQVILFFALGLLAKPMLVTLPFVLLLIDAWPLGRVKAGAKAISASWPLVREKFPLFALAAAASVITFFVQQDVGTMSALDRLPLLARVSHAFVSYGVYLWQMIWPMNLAAFYPYPQVPPAFWVTLLVALAIGGTSVAAIRFAGRHPYLPTGWFWFLGMLVPVIGLIQVGNQSTADRYTYLPFVGLFVILAWGIPDLLSRWRSARFVVPAAATAVVIACTVVARAQVSTWADSQTLWQHALDVMPDNYFAHGALGSALAEQNRLDEAATHLNEALRLKPDLADVQNDLGEVFARQGRLTEATSRFAEAVRIDPNLAEAHHNLGVALVQQGRLADATPQFNEALRLNPDLGRTHGALGNVLARQGRVDDAIRELLESLRLVPEQPDVHCNLAVLFQQKGDRAQARRHLETALTISPGHERARRMLDDVLKAGGGG